MKDNFSEQSDKYARFRPVYPKELYDFLLSITPGRETAWDCGTGNGQVAGELSGYFQKVYATDISEKQIRNAPTIPNIEYRIEPGESPSFEENMFDLICVAQAIHWFDFDKFYREVNRTSKPGGIIAVIGYSLIRTDSPLDSVIRHFYKDIVGPYWDPERKYIDENYQTIPFPFKELKSPELAITVTWTLEELIGYFETWSSVQHYIREKNQNPLKLISKELLESWGKDDIRTMNFPVLLRTGIVN